MQGHRDLRFAFLSSRPERSGVEGSDQRLKIHFQFLIGWGLPPPLRLFLSPLERFFQCSEARIPFVEAGDVLFLSDFHKLLKGILD